MTTILKPEETIPPAIAALGVSLIPGDPTALTYDLPLRKSTDPPPEHLDTAQLPCLFTFTGEGSYDWERDDFGLLRRIFRIQVACLASAEATPATRETRIRPILTKVRDYFAGYPSLNHTLGVLDARITDDSGVAILPEYDGRFLGFQLNLEVRYVIARVFASTE